MRPLPWPRWVGTLLIALLLAACALPPRTAVSTNAPDLWSGRMALTVEGDAGQSFSALFVLEGGPEHGNLTLSTPLGTVLAALRWAPGHAELRSSHGVQTADSLDALLRDTLGSAIPVQALFAWLRGDAATAADWQADLSQINDGRLTAVRAQPLPRATLRIALDH